MGRVGRITCLALVAFVWHVAPTAQEQEFSPAAIQQAIGQLGDEQFDVRQKASEFLWRAAYRAESALAAAVNSDDPEVRYRAAQILEKLRLGITPDTPPEVALLVAAYKSGNAQVRLQAIGEMRQKGL